jgi:hypothetical protein
MIRKCRIMNYKEKSSTTCVKNERVGETLEHYSMGAL